ncbi:hypothetical protein VTI74DRAFT_10809 [Chaetomium olivicolor]
MKHASLSLCPAEGISGGRRVACNCQSNDNMQARRRFRDDGTDELMHHRLQCRPRINAVDIRCQPSCRQAYQETISNTSEHTALIDSCVMPLKRVLPAYCFETLSSSAWISHHATLPSQPQSSLRRIFIGEGRTRCRELPRCLDQAASKTNCLMKSVDAILNPFRGCPSYHLGCQW